MAEEYFTKAKRTSIDLTTEVEINVYKVAEKRYALAGRNVTDVVNEPANSLLREMGVKSLKHLPNANPSLLQVRAEAGETFTPVHLDDAVIYWGKVAAKGNMMALGIIVALAIEQLEDRASKAFGDSFSEEERHERRQQSERKIWRMLDFACPGEPIFEDEFERHVCRITGLHKNDIKTGRFYWEFVYCWLTPDERSHLERINPVLPSGRRKYKIHDCLTPETKERLKPLQLKLIGKMESCKTVFELRRMIQRATGVDQPDLFDGFDFSATA